MPKRPILFSLCSIVLGLVFAGVVRYQLRHETASLPVILLYGLFLSTFCSLSLLAILALGKRKRGWLYGITGIMLLFGLFFPSIALADRVLGNGGSKLIGPFPILVLLPLIMALLEPVVKKRNHVS